MLEVGTPSEFFFRFAFAENTLTCRASANIDARRAHDWVARLQTSKPQSFNESWANNDLGVQGCSKSCISSTIRRHSASPRGCNETETSPLPELQTNPQYDRPILGLPHSPVNAVDAKHFQFMTRVVRSTMGPLMNLL